MITVAFALLVATAVSLLFSSTRKIGVLGIVIFCLLFPVWMLLLLGTIILILLLRTRRLQTMLGLPN
jgi:hypothetical protein